MKKLPSLPKLKQKALDLYSTLVKLKAANEGKLFCYTCDTPLVLNSTNCQLGHYLSRGAYPGLTFHPDNSRPQCYRCNCHLKGNVIEFRINLIAEIGIEAVEKLESERHCSVKFNRSDYLELIEKYHNEIKLLNG